MMFRYSHLIAALAGSRTKPGHLHGFPLGESDHVPVSQPPSKTPSLAKHCGAGAVQFVTALTGTETIEEPDRPFGKPAR